jgi:tRNA threonylcarbamoyladenosine biosynthesis protein TsaB
VKLLAIDTSSLACTVAVHAAERVIERYEVRPREHTRLLLPMIREILDEAGLQIAELDAIALGNGPGSFIGMRIGASVAQGLAYAAGLEIVPVSSMAAVARRAGKPGDTVVVTQDAHMSQVYLGRYEIGADREPVAVEPERLCTAKAGALPQEEMAVAAGAGFERYPELLDGSGILFKPDCLYPRAFDVLALGSAAFERGATIAPERLEPAYLREEVAQKA